MTKNTKKTPRVDPHELIAYLKMEPIPFTITTLPSPVSGGFTLGGGSQQGGSSCRVIAIPARGYTFSHWSEDGMEVSRLERYTFTVTSHRELFANFTYQEESSLVLPVHHFWSDQFGSHFYIMGDSERDRIAEKYRGIWNYEGVAWYAYSELVSDTEAVYRFWSDQFGSHFYIMGDAERDRIADEYRGIWNYEAVAWYACRKQAFGTDPVGRFWSDVFMGHFYIITEPEIDRIKGKYPGIWDYETVAFYAYKTFAPYQMKFSAEKTNDVLSEEPGALLVDAALCASEDIAYDLDVVYPLTASDCQVSAYVYDSATEQWANVVPITNSPALAVLENVQSDRSYLLDVFARDSNGGDMTSVYQSSFTYQLDPPEMIHEDSDAVIEGNKDCVGSLAVRIKTPAVDGLLTVKLYSSSQDVVKTLSEVLGGEIVEVSIPESNRWYWIGGWSDADHELVLSVWLRHERVGDHESH